MSGILADRQHGDETPVGRFADFDRLRSEDRPKVHDGTAKFAAGQPDALVAATQDPAQSLGRLGIQRATTTLYAEHPRPILPKQHLQIKRPIVQQFDIGRIDGRALPAQPAKGRHWPEPRQSRRNDHADIEVVAIKPLAPEPAFVGIHQVRHERQALGLLRWLDRLAQAHDVRPERQALMRQ